MSSHNNRIQATQSLLREHRLSGAVFAPSAQMTYLTGWAEYGHERLLALFLPAEGEPTFVLPNMHLDQARDDQKVITDIRGWADEDGWHSVVAELVGGWSEGGLAIDDELYSGHLIGIQSLFPGRSCRTAGELMAQLRQIKKADELDAMRRTAHLTDRVYEESLNALREGMTELEFQDVITQAYKRRGTKPEFALICFGANSAIPHHNVGHSTLKPGDNVIIDIGCLLDNYCSDITRTVAFGHANPEAQNVYRIVDAAHRAAMAAGKPGVTCEEVDHAARRVIEEAGFGPYFIHRTGHGIGLSCHEPPYIVKGNKQPLEVGMCFSDEPGIYLAGKFGVRIENIVTVNEDGLESLNEDPPRELLVIPA